MNPYDFVRINWDNKPDRRSPLWHHRLTALDARVLYSGRIEVEIEAEVPIFILDPQANSNDPTKAASFVQQKRGNQVKYILPGSSLKGVLRELVETLGNGCLTLLDGDYDYKHIREDIGVRYKRKIPPPFRYCSHNTQLCIACRIFGMMGRESTAGVFLGKVNINDGYSVQVMLHDPEYTLALMNPKPHHEAFYLDVIGQHIAGRKYYFHHAKPTFARHFIYIGNNPSPVNRLIQPLGAGTRFQFRIDFTSLEANEFAALLLAITLEPTMRHKIGYGKPMGLGSVHFRPTKLTLVDYTRRYTAEGVAAGDSKTIREGTDLEGYINAHIMKHSPEFLAREAMTDLRRIWRWPPDPDVDYYYPSKRDWFDTEDSIGKRIADTRNTP